MKREISVDELRFGMYVSELDRPWTETPFMFQGFVVKTDEQIAALKKYCKKVYVDPERAEVQSSSRLGTAAGGGGSEGAAQLAAARKTTYRQQQDVEQEFVRARATYAAGQTMLREMVDTVQTGKALDAPRVKESVTSMTDSVMRNPDALVLLTKLRDKGGNTLDRALDVSVYMIAFGRFLGLARDQIELLGMAGLLLDVGKVKVPSEILEKKGPLTAEEFVVAKTHVDHTLTILKETPGMPEQVSDIALMHHERMDGSGYPKGLQGKQIKLFGCIAGIADCFDALTSVRPYAEQVAPSNALNMMYKWRGSLFHEALVEQFIQCIGIYPVGSLVELNSGEIAVVVAQNLVRRLQPRVMVILDAKHNPLRPQKMLDLIKEPKATPTEAYRIMRTLEGEKFPIDPREFYL